MRVCLRLLGPVEVDGPTGPVRLGGPKERRLLAALAVHAGEVVSDDGLVDALWDGPPPRTAGKTLQNYVLRLRRALEGGTEVRIVTRPPGYVLHAPTTDVDRVETLVGQARRTAATGDHAGAVARFDEALDLWRGPALAEFATLPFALAEAARLDELREGLFEDRVAALLDCGRHHDAVATCETLVRARPLRERRWTQLMLALYRDGRQGEALAAYQRLRAVLADQLGVDPGPVARRLEASILGHETALDPRPRSVNRPARRSSTPCFGRQAEIDRLLEHLAEAAAGHGGVVFVHGEPGIGKSRLLAETASVAAGRGVEVLSGRCLEGTGALPYGPFSEALEGVLPGRASSGSGPLAVLVPGEAGPDGAGRPDLRPDERRLRLLDSVARFLADRARERPVLLLLDDLHWADDGTVALLRHTARTTGARKLLVVGAYRAGEVGPGHPLDDALGALSSETECRLLRLDGLDQPAVDQLLGAVAGAPVATDLAAAVRAETGGNPFFAREVVRHLQEDGALRTDETGRLGSDLPLSAVPDGVRHVIARRRRRLPGDANRLLDASAGVEGPFPYDAARSWRGWTRCRAWPPWTPCSRPVSSCPITRATGTTSPTR